MPVLCLNLAEHFRFKLARSTARHPGARDYLVSGDKRHLLWLKRHGKTQIVTVRDILEVLEAQK